jgi:hypothetical protein
MRIPLPGLTIPVLVIVVLVILVVIGLRVVPAPFPALPLEPGAVTTIPLPAGLPAPVERFYRAVYGERIPVITSVVVTGRAKVRPFGRPTFNARFRFAHIAGRSYRHYIEATFFGFPIMKINESYIDGHSRNEAPMGPEEGEPKTEQAANLGMWAELSGVPSVLLTDPRVHWEAVDGDTAILAVPCEGIGTERFLVRFDPKTGLVTLMEVMRYQRKDSSEKTLWVTEALTWDRLGEYTTSTRGSAWWYGASQPWAVFSTGIIVLNADLSGYIGKRGE